MPHHLASFNLDEPHTETNPLSNEMFIRRPDEKSSVGIAYQDFAKAFDLVVTASDMKRLRLSTTTASKENA